MTSTPTKVILYECSIGGVPFAEIRGEGDRYNYFHVQELRIYEDNCKFYFTGQLVIEAQLNSFEKFLAPQAEVVISFSAPPNSFIYQERFRVYSYESKPREGDIIGSMVVTISLIGDEYYKDKSSQVQQNFSNVTGSSAAAQLHNEYIAHNGGLQHQLQSIGMIGQTLHPHQVLSKQPSKAIHDLLDKSVFPVPSSGPAVYFRNKRGYVIEPLEHLIRNAPIRAGFIHFPARMRDMPTMLTAWHDVIHFRPMAPPGEDRGGARGVEFDGMNKVLSSLDLAEGNSVTGKGSGGSGYGSGVSKAIIDSWRQLATVDKNGPGGYEAREKAFLAQLTYSPKYWTSVPLQSGINVTVGERINVTYQVGEEIQMKTIWVARLIHELRFTEGRDRSAVAVNGTTDLFGVAFRG